MDQPDLFPTEPMPPYQRHSATSKAAARSVAPSAASLRERVYDYLLACGSEGATDAQGQQATGLSGDTYRPRRIELESAGRVQPVEGWQRATLSGRLAQVYVALRG